MLLSPNPKQGDGDRLMTPLQNKRDLYNGSFRRGSSVNAPAGTAILEAENRGKYNNLT